MLLKFSYPFQLTTDAFSSDELSRNYLRRYIVSGMYKFCTIGGYYWSSQGYQNCPVVGDDTIDTVSEPAKPAPASKQSGDGRKDEQPDECASRETRGTASRINASKTLLPTYQLVLIVM